MGASNRGRPEGPHLSPQGVCGISNRFQLVSPRLGSSPCITHPSATLPAGEQAPPLPFDLHVLGLPPAFNLSHDQTLQLKFLTPMNDCF